MATIQQLHCGLNVSSNSTPQNFQIPQAYSENESMPPLSAPGSPTNLSPTKMFKSQGSRQTLSPSSSYNPLMPLRLKSENNENQSTGLFDVLSNEEYIISQSAKKNNNNGNFRKLVDDFKSEKRSLSAEKTYKGASPVSRSIGLWAKENMPDSSEKNPLGFKKKQRSSTEQVNRSVGGEAIAKFENRKIKSNRLDLDSDLEINGRYNTEEGIEGLFDEEYYENIRESGPIRYSKMSEEDAATIFEIRRKELLTFLTKLGASSAVSKKKFVNKNALASRLSGQGSDIGKNDFHREKGIKRLQDPLKENSSPTHFIIYNTTSDSMWNNATNSQANKFATPSRDKKVASSVKAGCESAPGDKRMSSAKQLRERGDLSPQVERNLEASFNQLLEWSDAGEKRSPVKVVKKVESTPKVSEEKADAIESITINLAKTKLNKKKKKAKKAKNEGEAVCERVVIVKQLSEGVRGSPVWEHSEEQSLESKANQNDLVVIKKKNQNVMNEIAEIDSQIERMKESDNKTLMSFRRYEEDREFKIREEPRRPLYSEQEGYSLAAKMKKSAERSRSLSLKLAVRENLKHNESMQENYNRGGLKNKENNHEESTGDQSRRNQKVRFASDMGESIKNSSSQPVQKETKEKTLVRVPSQTNTLKVDLNKQNRGQTQKRALSNNTNVARNMQQERNSSLSTLPSPKVNSKDLKLKNIDLNKGNNDVNQSFNLNTSQTATNKTAEKKKPVNEFNGSRVKENQQPIQQLKSKKIISRTSETASTLQTVREHLLTSPKELAFSLRKTPVSNPTLKPEIPVVKKALSNCSSANKALLNYRKPANKSISLKSSQKSVSDKDYKDCSIDGIQIPNLFESQSSANFHEPTPSVPKIPFSKDTKKIAKEIPKEEKPVAPTITAKPKPSKSKEPTKVIRDVQLKVKKVEANRPDFDLNSSANLRAKILRQVRPVPENLSFLKASLSPNSNSDSSKLDMKTFGLEDFGISPVANLPSKKSETTDKSLLRKGSLSTPRGFRVVTSPAIASNRGCVALSLQDFREKLAEKACVETEEDNASLDSFRLREESLNLPLHPNQVGNQGQNVKDQETSKDAQTLKRKKGAGYSVC